VVAIKLVIKIQLMDVMPRASLENTRAHDKIRGADMIQRNVSEEQVRFLSLTICFYSMFSEVYFPLSSSSSRYFLK
jgi:hypothetical protein